MKHFIQTTCAIILLLVSITNVSPCTFETSVRKYVRSSKAIFIGEVKDIDESESLVIPEKLKDRAWHSVTFKVEKYWKGGDKSEITVFSNHRLACVCDTKGFRFQKGEKYLIYADKNLFADMCGGRIISLDPKYADAKCAAEDLRKLNDFWFSFSARMWPFG